MDKVSSPHDKLFRETWSNKEAARDLLQNYLPGDVLRCIDMESLEISKDSFIEGKLKDFYSDLLYKISLKGSQGFVYLLFEHKSYKDGLVHLQLLEYMLKIWRQHLKQNKVKQLPIIIPLVLYHGRTSWEISPKLSSLIVGPVDNLSDYIPDFEFIRYDLTRYSDEEIKGTILSRVVLLIMKHIFDEDLIEKLPRILSLINDLMQQDTGLRFLETILRYLFSTMDNITAEEMQTIVERSFTDVKGDIIMTLAEKWENEGFQKGLKQGIHQGVREGLIEGIELALILKFGNISDNQRLIGIIKNIKDVDRLKEIKAAILDARNVAELINRLAK